MVNTHVCLLSRTRSSCALKYSQILIESLLRTLPNGGLYQDADFISIDLFMVMYV